MGKKNFDQAANAITHIFEINRSLLTGLPFLPFARRGVSVHISLTFSKTMLQWRSKALTRANSLRLLRHEMSTWVWERTAVCKMESGPEVNSYSSNCAISNSLFTFCVSGVGAGGETSDFRAEREGGDGGRRFGVTNVSSLRGLPKSSL